MSGGQKINHEKIIFLVISPLFVFGQLSVINPSFEDPMNEGGEGLTPEPWQVHANR